MEIELNAQFLKVLELAERGGNIFLTGRAGTGKSTWLEYFRAHTQKMVAVLAPTGVAALNIRGETIHSFFGFKPATTLADARRLGKRGAKELLYRQLETLVIDEISMVRADLLDAVDAFLRAARKSAHAFGGVQVVFIGDLYQLPPVVMTAEREFFRTTYQSPYFFDAHVFAETNFELQFVELEKVYRQTQQEFIGLLNQIRNNSIDEAALARLNARVGRPEVRPGEEPIYLTTTNAMADEINADYLKRLQTRRGEFPAERSGKFDLKQLPTEELLVLKPGAQVMMLNNDARGRWVNGSLGRVVDFVPGEEAIIVRIQGGAEERVEPYLWEMYRYEYDAEAGTLSQESAGAFRQYPLRLAWAITIHKSQGKTFDRVVIDLGRGSFAHGQTYVALSRCRTFEGLRLAVPLEKRHVLMDYRVVRFLTRFQYRAAEALLPLEEKIALLETAIKAGSTLELTYLKADDTKSARRIRPLALGERDFKGYKFLGLDAYCFERGESRTFSVAKILGLKPVGIDLSS